MENQMIYALDNLFGAGLKTTMDHRHLPPPPTFVGKIPPLQRHLGGVERVASR